MDSVTPYSHLVNMEYNIDPVMLVVVNIYYSLLWILPEESSPTEP